ncbi:Dolichyl-phosphate beta-glucosyltransferase [Chelonia mydas]|uniref:Dolichyl-phosphate beta-glucosyltransferase n=1 Tax=Chelonia mydas TaxID=8469 RepID=M7ALI1_CHEMY|nr:Dolichyl-phosphate beta-glucosyltransferase [Chelonia mydas]
MPNLHRHEEEKFFINAEGKKESIPSIHDHPTKELSVVVPSYNEEDRLPLMMDEALDYLEKRQKRDPTFTYEVIVVDDGSKDQTSKVAMKYCKKYGSDKVRVLTLVKNRGKGGAVKMGVFSSRGEKILMADADGATKFADIEKVEEGLRNLQPWPDQMAIACGSRAHLEQDSITQRSYFRTLLMYGFHFLVWFLCVKEIRDTQCGFKLLTREAASRTFSALHIERWAFDVELLYIAQLLKIPIAEVAVNWTEIDVPHRLAMPTNDGLLERVKDLWQIPVSTPGSLVTAADHKRSMQQGPSKMIPWDKVPNKFDCLEGLFLSQLIDVHIKLLVLLAK